MKNIDNTEYKTLREELIARVQLMYSHNIGLITAIFAAFAVAAGVCYWFYGQAIAAIQAESSEGYRAVLTFGAILIAVLLLSPIGILLPFSVRNRDNIGQIESLSAYILVFAEIPSLLSKNKNAKKGFLGWENLHVKAVYEKGVLKMFNCEYPIFAIISSALFAASAVINIILSFKYEIMNRTVLLHIFLALLIATFIVNVIIWKKSDNSNFIKNRQACICKYKDYALENGFVAPDEKTKFMRLIEEKAGI